MFYVVIIERGKNATIKEYLLNKDEYIAEPLNLSNPKYQFALGAALAEFVPPEMITEDNWGKYASQCPNNWLVYFANSLYKFYCECKQDNSLYNEEYFLAKMSEYGYSLPKATYTPFKEYGKTLVEYKLRQKSEYQYKLDYMIAVAYELIRRKITLNKCEDCGKWFIAYNKTDTFYCAECVNVRNNKRKANRKLFKEIKDKLYYKVSKMTELDKGYYDYLIKYPNELDAERKKYQSKKTTLAELKEFGEWLKRKKREYFPKTKEGE